MNVFNLVNRQASNGSYLDIERNTTVVWKEKSSLSKIFEAMINEAKYVGSDSLTTQQWKTSRAHIDQFYTRRTQKLYTIQKIIEYVFRCAYPIHDQYQTLCRLIDNHIDSSKYNQTYDVPKKHYDSYDIKPLFKPVVIQKKEEQVLPPIIKEEVVPPPVIIKTTVEEQKPVIEETEPVKKLDYQEEWASVSSLAEQLHNSPQDDQLRSQLNDKFTIFCQTFKIDSSRLHLPYFGIKFFHKEHFYVVNKTNPQDWETKSKKVSKLFQTGDIKFKEIHLDISSSQRKSVVDDLGRWFENGTLPLRGKTFLSELIDLMHLNYEMDIPESKTSLRDWVSHTLHTMWGIDDKGTMREGLYNPDLLILVLQKPFLVNWVERFVFDKKKRSNEPLFGYIITALSDFQDLTTIRLPTKSSEWSKTILDSIKRLMTCDTFPKLIKIEVGPWRPTGQEAEAMKLSDPTIENKTISWQWPVTETKTITLVGEK